jgi:IgA Peptidase M64
MGHAAFGLGDEYEYDTAEPNELPRHYVGDEPAEPNLTASASPTLIPWFELVTPGVPLPSTVPDAPGACTFNHAPKPGVHANDVGSFEGAGHFACGVFRPAAHCRMRDAGDVAAQCRIDVKQEVAGQPPGGNRCGEARIGAVRRPVVTDVGAAAEK